LVADQGNAESSARQHAGVVSLPVAINPAPRPFLVDSMTTLRTTHSGCLPDAGLRVLLAPAELDAMVAYLVSLRGEKK
jgi:hypothetical protein